MNNIAYIIVFVISCVIVLIRYSIKYYIQYTRCTEEVKKAFVCPECGHRFYVHWSKLFYSRNYDLVKFKQEAILKCPQCNAKNRCQRPYDEA